MKATGEPLPLRSDQAIDVDELVADLRAVAAARRAAGGVDDHLLSLPFELEPDPRIRLRIESVYSTKPVIGPLITAIKRLLVRAMYVFLDDVVDQTNARFIRTQNEIEREQDERVAILLGRIERIESELAKERRQSEESAP